MIDVLYDGIKGKSLKSTLFFYLVSVFISLPIIVTIHFVFNEGAAITTTPFLIVLVFIGIIYFNQPKKPSAPSRFLLKMLDMEKAQKLLKEYNVRIINQNKDKILVECTNNLTKNKSFDQIFELYTNLTAHNCVTINNLSDDDINSMSIETLREKIKNIRDVAIWWAAQEGDDRCYLDDVKVLETILPHGSVNFEMPDDLTFIANCINFKKTRCPINPKIHEW